MATVTLDGKTCQVGGQFPAIGSKAPDFELVAADMSTVKLSDFLGEKVVLNVLPSIETGVCAAMARRFNEEAGKLDDNVRVLVVSKDLPFALNRFRAAEGLSHVLMTSAYRSPQFGEDYGVTLLDGVFATLFARAVIVLDADHTVVYTELVPEIAHEPDYAAALAALG